MNRDDIIRMAREAGFLTGTRDYADGRGGMPFVQSVATGTILGELERFAALVASAEREACAKASESQIDRWVDDRARYAASECAAAIRARGQA